MWKKNSLWFYNMTCVVDSILNSRMSSYFSRVTTERQRQNAIYIFERSDLYWNLHKYFRLSWIIVATLKSADLHLLVCHLY